MIQSKIQNNCPTELLSVIRKLNPYMAKTRFGSSHMHDLNPILFYFPSYQTKGEKIKDIFLSCTYIF